MTREEWHKWKKSIDPSYVIPTKEEDEHMQWDEENENKRESDKLKNLLAEEQEAQRQRDFQAFYNNPG